jgi:hypothetical protein
MLKQVRIWVPVALVVVILVFVSSLSPGRASPLNDDPQATIAAAEATQAAAFATIAAVVAGEEEETAPPPAEAEEEATPAPPLVMEGIIPFVSEEDPKALNPVWTWLPGEHPDNAYSLKIEPGALTLMAGDSTLLFKEPEEEEEQFLGPRLELPVSGDFEVQVRLRHEEGGGGQNACLGARSFEEGGAALAMCRTGRSGGYDSYGEYKSWEGIQVWGRKEGEEEGDWFTKESYGDPDLYLKMVRLENLVSLYYSDDGDEWWPIEEEYVFRLPSEVNLFLVVYSDRSEGFIARFWDFILSPL